jgi:hypothetical protein
LKGLSNKRKPTGILRILNLAFIIHCTFYFIYMARARFIYSMIFCVAFSATLNISVI